MTDRPAWSFRVALLDPHPPKAVHGWTVTTLFEDTLSDGWPLRCHVSDLAAGHVPHEPHCHGQAELIVPLSGVLEILCGTDCAGRSARSGDVVVHPSGCTHTLRAPTDGPARYVVLRWGAPDLPQATHGTSRIASAGEDAAAPAGPGWQRNVLIGAEGPGVRVHRSTMGAGSGYGWHRDDHDLALILTTGSVEVLSRHLDAPAVVFVRAGTPHGLRVLADGPAAWTVAEFHTAPTTGAPA